MFFLNIPNWGYRAGTARVLSGPVRPINYRAVPARYDKQWPSTVLSFRAGSGLSGRAELLPGILAAFETGTERSSLRAPLKTLFLSRNVDRYFHNAVTEENRRSISFDHSISIFSGLLLLAARGFLSRAPGACKPNGGEGDGEVWPGPPTRAHMHRRYVDRCLSPSFVSFSNVHPCRTSPSEISRFPDSG